MVSRTAAVITRWLGVLCVFCSVFDMILIHYGVQTHPVIPMAGPDGPTFVCTHMPHPYAIHMRTPPPDPTYTRDKAGIPQYLPVVDLAR